jgi:hypothetical protein
MFFSPLPPEKNHCSSFALGAGLSQAVVEVICVHGDKIAKTRQHGGSLTIIYHGNENQTQGSKEKGDGSLRTIRPDSQQCTSTKEYNKYLLDNGNETDTKKMPVLKNSFKNVEPVI